MSTTVAEFAALAIGVFGLAGIIFTALRFRRDDTTAVVNQQTQITNEMKLLAEEQREALARLREERDGLRSEVDRLTGQIQILQSQQQGNVTRLERRPDAGSE